MSSQSKAYQNRVSELESERNAMIIAHQCQISQLKESFKERMKSSDSWPDKLAFELNKEREKHNEIVKTIEYELRQNFNMVKLIQVFKKFIKNFLSSRNLKFKSKNTKK